MKKMKNKTETTEGMMLLPFMAEIIAGLEESGQTGTAINYKAACRSIRRFMKGRDLPVREIDSLLVKNYETYLKSTGLANNSISFYMRIMRAVFNRAVRLGLAEAGTPFDAVFTGCEKTRKRAISFLELKRIRNLDLHGEPELCFARDIFMFLFLCRGMSFIDAAFLCKTDVLNGTLTYSRRKTRQRLQIRIVRQHEEIIDRYGNTGSRFLLPIILHEGEKERRQYETSLRKVNNALKTIGVMAEIPIPLSTYVARHSWASIAKSRNIPVNVISDALGHDSLQTTQIYLDLINNDVIDKANDKVIRGL